MTKMDSHAAKEILRGYRPGTPDAAEPEVQTALEMVRRDPELSAWLEQQTTFHDLMRSQLRRIEVPPTLPDQIITANLRRQTIWWRRPGMLAAAAAAAILVGAVGLWLKSADEPDTFAAYRERMARAAQRDYRMGMLSRDIAEIRRYLQQNQGHGDFVLTPGLSRLPGVGGALLHWHDQPVSLVCLDGGNRGILYLFIANQTAFSNGQVARRGVARGAKSRAPMGDKWSRARPPRSVIMTLSCGSSVAEVGFEPTTSGL